MIELGRVVYSKAGRDKGKFLVVVGVEDDFLCVADGKERPLERPKRKNKKHLGFTAAVLDNGSMTTNKALKKSLAEFAKKDA